MSEPRVVAGTNRPHSYPVHLSDDELRALLDLSLLLDLTPQTVMIQALRVYQAALASLPPETGGCGK